MVFQFKSGFRCPVKAQQAGEELVRISQERQSLTPEIIVDESRPESATFHGCFDWNDETAAESWRKQQARCLVDNLITVSIDGKDAPEPVRAFVSIQGSYEPMNVVVKTKSMSDEMLSRAYGELKSFQRKYQGLSELIELFKAIDGFLLYYPIAEESISK